MCWCSRWHDDVSLHTTAPIPVNCVGAHAHSILTAAGEPSSPTCNRCYDLRFPELFRSYAWDRGCDLILHPSAFVRDATFPTYHAFVTTRAQENGVYLLSVSYAGTKFGSSIAAPPWLGPVPGLADEADELAPSILGTEEAILPLVVEPRTLSAVRTAYPYRNDRHPTLSHGLQAEGS